MATEEKLHRALDSAWHYLALRARSTAEVREHLVRKNFSHGVIARALEELCEDGYLDDYQLGCDLLRQAQARGWGLHRAWNKLRARGLAAEVAERCLGDGWKAEAEMAAAVEAARKRLAASDSDPTSWPRVARFLQGRGFSAETIRKVGAQLQQSPGPGGYNGRE